MPTPEQPAERPTPPLARADIERHAHAIRVEIPVPPGYPATGRAWPSARVIRFLRRAEWPVETVSAVIPHGTSDGRDAVQPVVVAPLVWLQELARRLGCDLTDVCRGLIPDEDRS